MTPLGLPTIEDDEYEEEVYDIPIKEQPS